jgi:hypothetical protein
VVFDVAEARDGVVDLLLGGVFDTSPMRAAPLDQFDLRAEIGLRLACLLDGDRGCAATRLRGESHQDQDQGPHRAEQHRQEWKQRHRGGRGARPTALGHAAWPADALR